MKAIKIYIISLIALMFTSCDALDLGAVDTYSLNNYWNTKEQCERFIIGLHGRMRTQVDTYMLMGELRGGLFNSSAITSVGQGANDIDVVGNTLTASKPGITNWGGLYADIYQMNHAIDKIENECKFFTDDERNEHLGQLYGMRAYYYFHLHRTFGGVPLCDQPDILNTSSLIILDKPRSSEIETFNFVKKDVTRSLEFYNSLPFKRYKNSSAYWNKAATSCLFAEVYLWGAKVKPIGGGKVYSDDVTGDLTKARDVLIASKSASTIQPVFSNVFSVKDNSEIILAIRYNIGEATHSFSNYTYPASTFTGYTDADGQPLDDPIKVGGGALRYEWKFSVFSSLSDDDSRKKATYFDFYKEDKASGLSIKGVFLNKFIGEIKNNLRYYNNDWPIYRYADVALLLAEISNELDDKPAVKTYLEEVRKRAYGAKMLDFSYTTKEAAEEAILAERDIEFVAEAKRWYDIRRMLGGKKAIALVSEKKEKLLLWPIDSKVLSTDSKVKQTDGY